MSVSQSGYPDIPSYGDPRLISNPTVPGSDVEILGGLLKGDVATILLYVAARFNAEVQRLVQSRGCWGFDESHNEYVSDSNHESATAEDLMAADHPIGTDPRDNYSAAQIRAIHKILNACRVGLLRTRIVRWGGDYNGRKDGMHFEINDNLYGNPKVAKLAARIRAGLVPNVPAELRDAPTIHGGDSVPVPSKPAPTPKPKPDPSPGGVSAPGVSVRQVQSRLNQHGAHLTVDNIWGPRTSDAVADFQRAHDLTADHWVGPRTWAALNRVTQPYPLHNPQVFGVWNEPGWKARTRSGDPRWDGEDIRGYVRQIQRKVGVTADGVYGPKTRAGVVAWQRKHGLTADGLVGRDTWRAMFA